MSVDVWSDGNSFFDFGFRQSRNFSPKYFKQSPSLSRAFANCFISPSLMWSGGSRTILGSTKLSRRTFLPPRTRDVLFGHTFLVQCLALSRLFNSQRKQGYFVFPPCCPNSIDINFKSPHMIHAWSLYMILLRIKSKFSYLSFKCSECPTGNDAYLFPLSRRFALKFVLDESISSLHLGHVECWTRSSAQGCRCNTPALRLEKRMARILFLFFYTMKS
jgi:hypothetical protein